MRVGHILLCIIGFIGLVCLRRIHVKMCNATRFSISRYRLIRRPSVLFTSDFGQSIGIPKGISAKAFSCTESWICSAMRACVYVYMCACVCVCAFTFEKKTLLSADQDIPVRLHRLKDCGRVLFKIIISLLLNL